MRGIVLGMALALAATPAVSAVSEQQKADCKGFSELASKIMEARQVGVPMADLMERKVQLTEVRDGLVIEAYKLPRYTTEAAQQRAITDFGNDSYLACIRNAQ